MNYNKQELKLSYDLTSTEDHTIDAAVLGNSLIHMAKLVKESDKLLNGEHSDAKVEVKAHSEGSFIVEAVIWLQEGGIDVLKALGMTLAGATGTAATFFSAVKALKNRTIKQRIRKNDGKWTLTLDDDTEMECPDDVVELLDNHSVRSHAAELINKPTKNNESAAVKFQVGNETVEVIEQDEVEYFKAPAKKTMQSETTREQIVNARFTVISLEKKTGWKIRLPDDEEVTVKIEAEAFWERINRSEAAFIKGELFEMKLKTITKTLDGKPSYTRSITDVIRHRVEESKKLI